MDVDKTMTAGYFSPMPPARTGVADYSAALVPALRRLGPVNVNGDDGDVNLYHLGNNRLHAGIYAHALRRPGVVVIHDAVLHHFFLGQLPETDYLEEFAFNYGSATADLATSLWRDRSRSATDPRFFRFPLLRRIAETARAVIVHNPGAAAMVRAHAPDSLIFEIPHLFAPPPQPGYEVERLRHELTGGTPSMICGVFGYLREAKRLNAILRVFHGLRHPGLRLLIAGEIGSEDLARSITSELAGPGVIRRGYLGETDFWRYAAATDVCINPRFPGAGETSGIAIRMMGLGKPVILSEGLETSRFPPGSCLRLTSGQPEEEMLREYLTWLLDHPEQRREMGRRAAEHIAAEHSLSHVAELYWAVLRQCASD